MLPLVIVNLDLFSRTRSFGFFLCVAAMAISVDIRAVRTYRGQSPRSGAALVLGSQAEWAHNSVLCHDSGFWGQISELSKRSGRTTRFFATIRGSGGKYPSYPSGVATQLGFLPRFEVLGTNNRVIQVEWPHNSGFRHDSGIRGQISELSMRSGRTTRDFVTIQGSGVKIPSYPSGVATQLRFL